MNIIQQIREQAAQGPSGDDIPANTLLPILDALDAAMAEISGWREHLAGGDWPTKETMLATDAAMEKLR